MVIKTRITFKEYVKLLYSLAYKKPMMIVIACVGAAMLVWICGYYLHLLPVPEPTFYQYATLTIIGVIQPLVIYSTIWKNYHSSNFLKEPLEMEFTPTLIRSRGESFYTEYTWEKIFKVDELKSWFLIYQNNLSAIMVPKKSFSPEGLDAFKALLSNIPDIPVHLKDVQEKH